MPFETKLNRELDNYRLVQGWMLKDIPEETHIEWLESRAPLFNALYNSNPAFKEMVIAVQDDKDPLIQQIREHLESVHRSSQRKAA